MFNLKTVHVFYWVFTRLLTRFSPDVYINLISCILYHSIYFAECLFGLRTTVGVWTVGQLLAHTYQFARAEAFVLVTIQIHI